VFPVRYGNLQVLVDDVVFLNKREDGDNVQNCDSYINILSSQTYR
jgi:hypothetical protein